jgi:hypothetical protein
MLKNEMTNEIPRTTNDLGLHGPDANNPPSCSLSKMKGRENSVRKEVRTGGMTIPSWLRPYEVREK